MKTFLIRGVPHAMQQDGWWLNGPSPRGPKQTGHHASSSPDRWHVLVLAGLIALGDVMVWQVIPGVSLAVFGAGLVLAALWAAGDRVPVQRQVLVIGGSLLALLPLVELVQPLSLMIACAGISAGLALLAGLKLSEVARGALRLWPCGLRQTFVDGSGLFNAQGGKDRSGLLGRLVMGWLVPVVMGLIFVVLLLEANPIAARWAENLWAVRSAFARSCTDRLLAVPVAAGVDSPDTGADA